MSRSLKRSSLLIRLSVAALGGTIGAFTFALSPALARSLVPSMSIQGGGTSPSTSLVSANSPSLIYLLLIVFGFGSLLIASLLFYIYKIQTKYYTITQRLNQLGHDVKATPIHSLELAGTEASLLAETSPVQSSVLTIDGPGFIAVGSSADFTVTKLDKGAISPDDADKVQWEVTPKTAATLDKYLGAKVTASPKALGAFHLVATFKEKKATGAAAVTGVTPQATAEELPFVGQGYGSLTIAILVVFAVVVLALTGSVSSDVVATLFGGLLGYIFGVATSSGGTSSKKPSGGSSGTGG